jgi:uncharacterized protein YacL
MNNKIWRLSMIILLITMVAALCWYLSNLVVDKLVDAKSLSASLRPLYWGIFTLAGSVFGIGLGGWLFRRMERLGEQIRRMDVRDKLALTGGLTLGIFLTAAVSFPVFQALPSSRAAAFGLVLLAGVVLTYIATAAALSMKEEIRFYMPAKAEDENKLPQGVLKIFDTNVIIDGRIADIAKAGFLDGTIYIPGFVLDELQLIADSSDGLKRARGRRGLDILNQMQKELELVVRTYDRYAPEREAVDSRLVKLAKALNASLVTNDFNLNKVAELQGVPVLNINELANALKPVVLPGEEMRVAIVKEGKDHSQGIGYLDDGTMIVVEGGRKAIGETVEVVVSSLLQTTAGKMIFAHLRDEAGDDDIARGVRPYTRGGARNPIRGRRE